MDDQEGRGQGRRDCIGRLAPHFAPGCTCLASADRGSEIIANRGGRACSMDQLRLAGPLWGQITGDS